MTTTADTETAAPAVPADYAWDLGEMISAYRLYIGLSQRGMAFRLGKDRRDFQRIESGRDACPPGFLTKIEDLVELFDQQVDKVMVEALKDGGAEIVVQTSPLWEWDRLVAGRAAVLAAASEEHENARITLTVIGDDQIQHRRSQP